MNEMQGIARIKIHAGKLDEFKRLAAKCVEVVRTQDPGTLQYELYLNHDETECLVFERYRDPEAGLAHSKNVAQLQRELSEVCTIAGQVCGVPSPELRQMLASAGVALYAPFLSAEIKR